MKLASAYGLSMIASLLFASTNVRAESIKSEEVMLIDPETNRGCLVYFEKSGPEAVKSGDFAYYHIKVENRSDCILTTLKVTDHLSPRTRFEKAFPEPDFFHPDRVPPGGVIGWKDQRLHVGQTLHYKIKVRVEGKPHHTLYNRACVKNRHLGPDEYCVEIPTYVLPGHPHMN